MPVFSEALAQPSDRTPAARRLGPVRAGLAAVFCRGATASPEAQARLAAELTAKESPSFQAGPLSWLARSLGRQGRACEGLVQAEGR